MQAGDDLGFWLSCDLTWVMTGCLCLVGQWGQTEGRGLSQETSDGLM